MWTCDNCGERIEENSDVCWKCGTSKDGQRDPDFGKDFVPSEAKKKIECPVCHGTDTYRDVGIWGTLMLAVFASFFCTWSVDLGPIPLILYVLLMVFALAMLFSVDYACRSCGVRFKRLKSLPLSASENDP